MQKIDFVNFRKYYKQASVQLPKKDFYQDFITHKVVHSAQVLRMGVKIIKQTPELTNKTPNFIETAERALLFHDVGRFAEGVLRWQAINQKEEVAASSLKFNHCELGYHTLLENPTYNDPRILAAVKFHGMMLEDVYKTSEWKNFMTLPQNDDIKQILLLVRDADKLANLFVIKNEQRLYHDIFYKQLTEELHKAPLSKETVQQFFANQVIRFQTVKSWADRLLMVLSWIYDINYPVSHDICCKMGCFEYLLTELERINPDSQLQKEIADRVNNFYSK